MSHGDPELSVIVRARDEAASIGRCLELLRAQEPGGEAAELLLVDSGSRDRTVQIAEGFGARVLEVAPSQFSFGGALNLGAQAATGQILVALSAHAFATDPGWLARLKRSFDDPRVACAAGERYLPDGTRLDAPVLQDHQLARRHPEWGFTNAAGGFRAAQWCQRRFREDLPGCEDKDWAAYWLERGYLCMVDPQLLVDHDHTHDPVRSIYVRARREAEGLSTALSLPPYGSRQLLRDWWSDLRFYSSPARARLSHRRAARLLGSYAGRRRASRGRL